MKCRRNQNGRAAPNGTSWCAVAIAAAAFGALTWLEWRRSLRGETEAKTHRLARNLAIAGVSAAALQMAERPISRPLARWSARRRMGLLYELQEKTAAPDWLRDAAAVVLLDYTLYSWHVLEHRWPMLYRFHVVHHADLDLDASTALRFHFGELLASIPWRAGQIFLIGVSPRALLWWQRLLFASIVFHHSNLRLPIRVERRLARLIVTPRLHGIHHSIVREEQNSNWSSGLSIWDRLHGTFRPDVPQHDIEIGVPAFRTAEAVTLGKMLMQPIHEPPPWRCPDGSEPRRGGRPPRTKQLQP
ncbi:MAG: sterol desaturase family protein [Gemmatimonadota bacterium]